MKKITILLIVTCILLAGCSISVSGEDINIETSMGFFNTHTSYFEKYIYENNENTCKVSGRLHQIAEDQSSIAYVAAAGQNAGMTVTGSLDCRRGEIRLVYLAPDGAETLIADGTNKKVDAQVDVAEGEGTVSLISGDRSADCEFHIKLEAGDGVTFTGDMEDEESADEDCQRRACRGGGLF